ncbi:hypothetical protein GCM10020000_74320 [Streptomyces olivoverticillatus]
MEGEEAEVGGVEDAEAVFAGGDLEVGPGFAVGEDGGAVHEVVHFVDEGAGVVDAGVAEHDRYVVLAGGQGEGEFGLVA